MDFRSGGWLIGGRPTGLLILRDHLFLNCIFFFGGGGGWLITGCWLILTWHYKSSFSIAFCMFTRPGNISSLLANATPMFGHSGGPRRFSSARQVAWQLRHVSVEYVLETFNKIEQYKILVKYRVINEHIFFLVTITGIYTNCLTGLLGIKKTSSGSFSWLKRVLRWCFCHSGAHHEFQYHFIPLRLKNGFHSRCNGLFYNGTEKEPELGLQKNCCSMWFLLGVLFLKSCACENLRTPISRLPSGTVAGKFLCQWRCRPSIPATGTDSQRVYVCYHPFHTQISTFTGEDMINQLSVHLINQSHIIYIQGFISFNMF